MDLKRTSPYLTHAEFKKELHEFGAMLADTLVKGMDGIYNDLRMRIDKLEQKVDQGFAQIEFRFKQIDARFEQIEFRFEQINHHFEEVHAHLDTLDRKLDRQEDRTGRITYDLQHNVVRKKPFVFDK